MHQICNLIQFLHHNRNHKVQLLNSNKLLQNYTYTAVVTEDSAWERANHPNTDHPVVDILSLYTMNTFMIFHRNIKSHIKSYQYIKKYEVT